MNLLRIGFWHRRFKDWLCERIGHKPDPNHGAVVVPLHVLCQRCGKRVRLVEAKK